MKKLLTTTAILCALAASSGAKADPADLLGNWCPVADGLFERGETSNDPALSDSTCPDNEGRLTIYSKRLRGHDWECSITNVGVNRRQHVARPVYTLSLQCRGEGEQWSETRTLFLGKNDNLVMEVLEVGNRSIADFTIAEDVKLMYKLCRPPSRSDVSWCSETLTRAVKAYPGFCQRPNAPCPSF